MNDLISINKISKNIKLSLRLKGIKSDSQIVNSNNSILINCVKGKNANQLFIWIKVYKKCDKYILDISHVILPINKRKKRVFELIYKRLLKCRLVDKIIISSVCSIDMKNWCLKHKLIDIGDGLSYASKVS